MLLKFQPKVEHLKCIVLTPKEGLSLTRTMVTLLPGTNEVTDDEWKAMRGNIVDELENKEIIILAQKVSAGRGKVGGARAKNLKDMPVNIAVKYVNECNNPDTLKKWYGEITNEEVRLAITKKFKKLDLELPEDEIPDTPNESPMSLEEYDLEDEDAGVVYDDDDEDFEDEDDSQLEEDAEDEGDVDYSKMSVAELKSACKEKDIDISSFTKKADYINALMESEE